MRIPLGETQKVTSILAFGCLMRAANIPWNEMGLAVEVVPHHYGWKTEIRSSGPKPSDDVVNDLLCLWRHARNEEYNGCEDYKKSKDFLESFPSESLRSFPSGVRCPAVRTLGLIPNGMTTMPASFGFHNFLPPLPGIEKGIEKLVKILNSISGITMVWSCEGHFYRRLPFVRFLASETVVKRIDTILKSNPFDLTWEIRGRLFNHCPRTGPYILWEIYAQETKSKFPFLYLRKARKDIAKMENALTIAIRRGNGNGS